MKLHRNLLLVTLVGLLAACGTEDPVDENNDVTSADLAAYVRDDVFPTLSAGFITKADAIQQAMVDEEAPALVDLRRADDYAVAHIPGAVNMTLAELASDANMTTLDGMADAGNGYVAYCYSAHTAGIGTAVMNVLGYPAKNMKYGMVSWNQNYGSAPEPDGAFAVETEANEATETFELPAHDFTGITNVHEAALAATRDYLENRLEVIIKAPDLFALISDEDDTNDPFIIDVRAADDYAAGHVPGAVNIPFGTLFEADNLAKIPTDRPVVVYCYMGMSGGIATGLLGVLGYDSVNLYKGFPSWSTPAEFVYYPAADLHEYTIEGTAAAQ